MLLSRVLAELSRLLAELGGLLAELGGLLAVLRERIPPYVGVQRTVST
jgi:hypothetical protein